MRKQTPLRKADRCGDWTRPAAGSVYGGRRERGKRGILTKGGRESKPRSVIERPFRGFAGFGRWGLGGLGLGGFRGSAWCGRGNQSACHQAVGDGVGATLLARGLGVEQRGAPGSGLRIMLADWAQRFRLTAMLVGSWRRSVRGSDSQVFAMERGAFAAGLTRVDLHHLWMQRARLSLSTVVHSAIHRQRSAIVFLASTEQAPVLNTGVEVSPGELCPLLVWGPTSGESRSCFGWNSYWKKERVSRSV